MTLPLLFIMLYTRGSSLTNESVDHYFSSIVIIFYERLEINKITKIRCVQVFLFREMRKVKFCQKFVKFRKVLQKF